MDKLKATTIHDFLTAALEKKDLPRTVIKVVMRVWLRACIGRKSFKHYTLFLNYVLNELPSISKQKLAWRKFGGANDFDCPCGKA